jgi:hypothetical protein
MEYNFKIGDIVIFKPNYTTQHQNEKFTILEVLLKEDAIRIIVPHDYTWWNSQCFELDKTYMRKEKLKQLRNEHI